jgi:hypothetical protein
MTATKNQRKLLRQRAAQAGIFSIAELARQVGCSREAIYFAVEKPSRFPRVHSRIDQIIQSAK